MEGERYKNIFIWFGIDKEDKDVSTPFSLLTCSNSSVMFVWKYSNAIYLKNQHIGYRPLIRLLGHLYP